MKFIYALKSYQGIMVAGGRACLRISDLLEPSNSIIGGFVRAASLCNISHKHGSVLYYQQPRPFSMNLCLGLV